MKPLNHKICRVCKQSYPPFSSLSKTCSILCAIKLTKIERERKEARDTKVVINARREVDRKVKASLKTKSQWVREAQAKFNQFIRLRDKDLPCISCQRHHPGQNHAGHYLSIGANRELRFHEDNCHLQCSVCNNHFSGNQIRYRQNLIEKIGEEKVLWLEGPHQLPKLTVEQIKAVKAKYAAMVKGFQTG